MLENGENAHPSHPPQPRRLLHPPALSLPRRPLRPRTHHVLCAFLHRSDAPREPSRLITRPRAQTWCSIFVNSAPQRGYALDSSLIAALLNRLRIQQGPSVTSSSPGFFWSTIVFQHPARFVKVCCGERHDVCARSNRVEFHSGRSPRHTTILWVVG